MINPKPGTAQRASGNGEIVQQYNLGDFFDTPKYVFILSFLHHTFITLYLLDVNLLFQGLEHT